MLKIATWNVNGIRARAEQVRALLEDERPDVVCLQEVKASPDAVPEELRELPAYFGHWHGHKGYSGVALLLSRETFGARPAFVHPPFDFENRVVTALAGGVLFASIYLPNGGKDFPAKVRFLDELDAFCASAHAAGQPMIVCGDLNVARELRDVHPKLQNLAQTGQTPSEKAQLERVISRGLVDLSRKFHPDDDQLFTWWAPWRNNRERNIGWRLDYVLPSETLAAAALTCEVQTKRGTSDHAPVIATFDLELPRAQPSGEEPPKAEKTGQLRLLLR
jgi:exodeoxyribonuclease-3